MTLRWLALFLALLAHLAGWVLRPRRRLNWMTPAALEQWRRGQRRMGYPATLLGLSLATWGAHTAGAGYLALQLAAGIVLAIALRSLLSLARAWCWVHGWGVGACGARATPRGRVQSDRSPDAGGTRTRNRASRASDANRADLPGAAALSRMSRRGNFAPARPPGRQHHGSTGALSDVPNRRRRLLA